MTALLRRIHEDLGNPPIPSWRDFLAFAAIVVVGFAMTFVGPA